MRNSKLRVVAAVAMLCLAGPTLAEEVTIRGTVLDADGNALSGAVLELKPWISRFEEDRRRITGTGEDEALAAVRSDRRGTFRLSAPAGGSYLVEVSADGRLSMRHRLVHLFADVELRPLELPAVEEVVLRVVDASGQPLPGAQIGLTAGSGFGGRWWPGALDARTGAEGTVKLEYRRRGAAAAAFAPGFVPEVMGLDSGTVTLELAAGKPRTIEVRDAGGGAVPEALVSWRGWPLGITDQDGRWIVHPSAEGDFEIVAETAAGHRAVTVVAAPAPAAKGPVVVVLREPDAFTGLAIDASTKEPVAGVRVWLEKEPHRYADSGRDGVFRFSASPAPRRFIRLGAAKSGFIAKSIQRTADDGDVLRYHVEMQPAVILHGRVLDEDGRSISGAEISSYRETEEVFVRSRADGGFLIPAVPGERLGLMVSKADYLSEQVWTTVTGDRPEDVEIVLRQGVAGFGQVVDADGEPVPGAEVGLGPQGARRDAVYRLRGSAPAKASADGAGRFELRNLGPGTFDLWASAPGYAEGSVRGVEIRAADEGPIDLGTVVLEPGVVLRGKTVDPDGRPLAGVGVYWISWHPGGGHRGFSGSGEPAATSDEAGDFVIADLARGRKITLETKLKGYTQTQAVGVEPGTGEPVVLELQPRARIRGVVVDAGGEPVPEARVMARYESTTGGGRGTGRDCDAEGSFDFSVDASGRLLVTASAPGFSSTAVRLEIAPGQVVEDLRLVLSPGAILKGRVLGPDGSPLAGAEISASQAQMAFRPPDPRVTDGDGRFEVEGLDAGQLYLNVDAEGLARETRQIDLQPGTNEVEIRFDTPYEIHGRVIDESWRPVAEARVSARSPSRSSGARTDADGNFVIEGLADGSYRLTAFKRGFVSTTLDREVEIAGGPVLGVEIRLRVGGAIVGRVLGVDIDRLPGVLVMAEQVGRLGASPRMAKVDAEGGFRVENLPSGEWTLKAVEETSHRNARGVAVLGPDDDEVFVELEFVDGVTLAGRVLIDGAPAAGVEVEARGLDVLSESRMFTDYRGSFRLVDLRPGRYQVDARRDELVERLELDLETDREIEIELSTRSIGGRVIDAADDTALAVAEVSLRALSDGVHQLPDRSVPRLRTDSQGSFRFVGVAEGTYRLRAEHPGYAILDQPVAVEEGADLEQLELRLERTEGLTLEVRTANGGIPRQVYLVVLDRAGAPLTSGTFPVGNGGVVQLPSVPAGRWQLVICGDGTAMARLPVEVPGERVTVMLPLATRIDVKVPELIATGELATLTVTDSADRPFLGVGLAGPYSRQILLRSEWPVRAGWATIEELPPGNWRLSVTAPDGRSWETSVTAPENGGHLFVELE